MNGKLLIGIIVIMLLVNGILVTIALKKRSSSTSNINTPSTQVTKKSVSQPTTTNETSGTATALESCFKYYDYGKVRVDLASDQGLYDNAKEIKLSGSIANENTFPLNDVMLYAHVKRINKTTFEKNGHFLIDRIPLLKHINLLPSETKHVTIDLPINPNYPRGDYQIQYFVLSENGFHYGGRAFLEEDNIGTTNFSLNTGPTTGLVFDIDNLQINGSREKIRDFIKEYPEGPTGIDVNVIDSRQSKEPVPIVVKFYSFEDTEEKNLVKELRMTLANTDDPLHVDFTPSSQGAYVAVFEIDTPVRTLMKYRFAYGAGTAANLRMNDLGVSDFPATKKSRAWVCFHSPSSILSPNTKITLSYMSDDKKIIDQTSYTASLPPDVQAFSIPLSKLTTLKDFWIQAQLQNSSTNTPYQTVELHYNCEQYGNSLKDIKVNYVAKNPPTLVIQGTNACGEDVKTGTINLVRIKRLNILKKEETNITSMPYKITLERYQPGIYTAEVFIGNTPKKTTFTISDFKTKTQTESKKIYYIALFIVTALISILSILLIKRLRDKPNSNNS
ncbi:hypothetical protein BH09PAT2_BH09PAT2_05910 [soil metagenome]